MVSITACAPRAAESSAPGAKPAARIGSGMNTTVASWYGGGEGLSRRTASGEAFQPDGMTAAHRTLPFGTKLEVTSGARTVVVRVNDRGPFTKRRSLDVSRGAARALGFLGRGTARVTWRVAGQ